MKISTINYLVSDAFVSLRRNKTISFASIITVLITFMVLGIFSIIAKDASLAIEGVESKVELKVFLKDDVQLIDKREIEVKLRDQAGVKSVVYESKEEAFNNIEKSMGESEGLLQGYSLDKNPFPESYIVKLEDPSYAQAVGESVKELQGVESISNQQDIINTVQNVIKGIRIVGIVLFIILIGVSVFLIMNTTKLAVYSRRREVGIMKFVGATDWFIRWPFIIEGMVMALLGALLSTLVVFAIYKGVFAFVASKMLMVNLVDPTYVFKTLLWKFALGSIAVGGTASYAALRKFLVV
ncbi:permease-like cell division protein FtsX [Clostridium sp. SHJSY1]|uniref:permease-like cell division protein FtsX n=1 Tax=Clostridium sp. SHJSY1 TaxID=2942483 RepID=UPI0028766BB0|nr:permease-like cell division protein FtsX [Clostridium sp. SHJSY1]MDS0526221.1 permease-like cell division protein FtsX [Clostridium sp. SHJSY1]